MNIAARFSGLADVLTVPPVTDRHAHVETRFTEYERQVLERTNGFFLWLLILQWVFAVVFAAVWSPRAWAGIDSSVHPHLLAAIVLGTLLVVPPVWLIRTLPYHVLTRHVVAAAQMGFSALLIDLTGGRIETHFHVFGSLAFVALYRDWRVLPTATAVVAFDHLLRGIYFPLSVYGVPFATIWRTAEHAGWVVFEDVVLAWACLVSRREMWEICVRHDQNDQLLVGLEERVRGRTRDLEAAVHQHERTAQDLRRSEERYRQLITNIPIGIVEATRTGEVRLVNPPLWAMLGMEGPCAGERLALVRGRLIPAGEREAFWARLEAEGEVRGFETRLERHDGSALPIVLNAHLKRGDGGREPILEATVEDVSERRKAAEELEVLHRQLIVASRQAGQADVATGVLHNVGNVLTSVNLIVHDVQDRLKLSRLSLLHRLAQTIEQQRHRLPEFVASDPIGVALPDFIGKLDAHLGAENERLISDIRVLVQHFEHIREIIQAQQSSARMLGVIELLAPEQLMEDAIRLNEESFARHGIAVVRDFGKVAKVRADRHKVLQILVNLLANAKDSLIASATPRKRVVLRIGSTRDAVTLRVEDNGLGIAPGNLLKVFQHGFTTKPDGHGFGLHSCALAARDMNGEIDVSSPGEGLGAAFTLRLPATQLS